LKLEHSGLTLLVLLVVVLLVLVDVVVKTVFKVPSPFMD
jgi:hypothetical protein